MVPATFQTQGTELSHHDDGCFFVMMGVFFRVNGFRGCHAQALTVVDGFRVYILMDK